MCDPGSIFCPTGGLTDDNDANSLEGFIDDQAWSEAEREHQKARHRRKNRQALRPRARPLPIPPIVSHTIRQPEKFSCPHLPSRGQIESFEEKLVAEFRSFTSLGESAEAYIRIVFATARSCSALESTPEWEEKFESLAVDQTAFVIADEKMKCSMQNLLSDQHLSRWHLRSKARRELGLPAASARQLLFFILSFHHLGARLDEENALFPLMRLRDTCIREPLKPATLPAFLTLWDRIMMQSSATQISEQELERIFFQCVQHAQHSDLQHEIRFYRESPAHMQGQPALRRRIDKMIYI